MRSNVAALSEQLATKAARVRLLASMAAHMSLEVPALREGESTVVLITDLENVRDAEFQSRIPLLT